MGTQGRAVQEYSRRRFFAALTVCCQIALIAVAANRATAGVDLTTALTDTPDPVLASSVLTYQASWSNSGDSAASEVDAQLAMPAEVEFVSLFVSGSTGPPEGCAYNQPLHRVECTFFDFGPARTVFMMVNGIPAPEPVGSPSSYDMFAAAVATSVVEVDTDPSNDLANETTTVFTCPSANPCLAAHLEPDGVGGYVCAFSPNDGALCSAPCFEEGICVGAVCELGPPIVCAPVGEACQENACNPLTDACELQDIPDSTPCSSGDACRIDEACSAGVCEGGTILPGCGPAVPIGGTFLLPVALGIVGAVVAARHRPRS